MKYKAIHDTFWTDPLIGSLSSSDKLLFLYLITNPHTHFSGIYYLPTEMIVVETGLPRKMINKGINTLIDKGIVRGMNNIIWVKNMLKYQVKNGKPNVKQMKGIEKYLRDLHKCPLIKDFTEYYKLPIDTPTYTPIDTLRYNQDKDKDKDKDIYKSLCNEFKSFILVNKPDYRFKADSKWPSEFKRMIERDKRDPDKIKEVMQWALNDAFWKANILSPSKLREKFDQLEIKMGEEEKRDASIGRRSPNAKGSARKGKRENGEEDPYAHLVES